MARKRDLFNLIHYLTEKIHLGDTAIHTKGVMSH